MFIVWGYIFLACFPLLWYTHLKLKVKVKKVTDNSGSVAPKLVVFSLHFSSLAPVHIHVFAGIVFLSVTIMDGIKFLSYSYFRGSERVD